MSQDRSILGIHVDGDWLHIVHLSHRRTGLYVSCWTSERLEEGTVKDGVIVQTETVAKRVRAFIKANHVRTRKATMPLSCSTVRLRSSEFPAESDDRLRRDVRDQIAQYGLFGNREITFDYCAVAAAGQVPEKRTVIEAITAREAGDACLRVARKVRLDLVELEPVVLPIINLIHDNLLTEAHRVSLLLTLESTASNVCVFKNGLPHFCQNIAAGAQDVLQDARRLACLTTSMRRVGQFARALAGSQQLVLRTVASCGTEHLCEIADKIKETVGDVVVEQIDSAQMAGQCHVQGADSTDLPVFALAAALTALGVSRFAGPLNLASKESVARHQTQDELSLMARAIVAIVLLSVGVIVPLRIKTRAVKAVSTDVEAQVAEGMTMKRTIADLTRQITELEGRQSSYVRVSQELPCIPWPHVLRVIGDTVPDAVRIVDLATTDSAAFTLMGHALAESDVYRFAENLQNTEVIAHAQVERIEYDSKDAMTHVAYRIACTLRWTRSDL